VNVEICRALDVIKVMSRCPAPSDRPEAFIFVEHPMDVIMLAIGFVFFALSIGYVYACDRL
jgi:hypothetical protein